MASTACGPTESTGGLPALTLPCLGGGANVDLAGLRGPLLLNFWAQYCTPCQEESPLLEQLSRAARGQVEVVGVDFIDPLPGRALAFAKEHGLTYPQIADPAAAAKGPLRISGLPFTFFVDAAGTDHLHPGRPDHVARASSRHSSASTSASTSRVGGGRRDQPRHAGLDARHRRRACRASPPTS